MRDSVWLISHDTLLRGSFCPDLSIILFSCHIQRKMLWAPWFVPSLTYARFARNYLFLEVSAGLLPQPSRALSRSHVRRRQRCGMVVAVTCALLFEHLLLLAKRLVMQSPGEEIIIQLFRDMLFARHTRWLVVRLNNF